MIIFVELFDLCGISIFYWIYMLYLKAYMLILEDIMQLALFASNHLHGTMSVYMMSQ